MTLGDARLVVARVVLRLLRRLPDEAAVADAVDAAMPQIEQLSDRLELVRLVGHEEHSGHKLVTEGKADELQQEFSLEVSGRSADQLSSERDLTSVMMAARKFTDSMPTIELTPAVTTRLLISARSETRGQSVGSRAVRRSYRLWWDALVEIAGGSDKLGEALDRLEEETVTGSDDDLQETIALARQYLSGWRPKDFGDD